MSISVSAIQFVTGIYNEVSRWIDYNFYENAIGIGKSIFWDCLWDKCQFDADLLFRDDIPFRDPSYRC